MTESSDPKPIQAAVLAVDDIAANRSLLRETLEPHGYDVLLASSGEMALKALQRSTPDAILLDVNMPGMDGFETCRRIKAEAATRQIPVIFLTANDETGSLVQAFQAGGADYVPKPFRSEELLARLETHIRLNRLGLAMAHKNRELTQLNEELSAEIRRRTQAEQSLSIIEDKSINKFHAGGTLNPNATTYVERRADRDLWQGLRESEFCYVLTSRQMGKSSLMVRTAHRLRAQGVQVVTLDLTAMGQNVTPEQWYGGLASRIGWQMKMEDEIDDYWMSQPHLSPVQRFFKTIRNCALAGAPKGLVIFVDELDMVRSLPFPTGEFFAAIRECYNRRSEDPAMLALNFCVLGVATPSELIEDPRMTPFNLGHRIEIEDFSPEEAAPLARGFQREPAVARELLDRVLHWSGGHPYLTQKLCKTIAADDTIQTSADLDEACHRILLSPESAAQDDNLIFVRERLRRSASVTDWLDLYEKIWNCGGEEIREESPVLLALKLSGLVRLTPSGLAVRNRIYAHVFGRDWIAAMRRQGIASDRMS